MARHHIGGCRVAPRFAPLIDDVERNIFDRSRTTTWFYPGHGKDSNLGTEPLLWAWHAGIGEAVPVLPAPTDDGRPGVTLLASGGGCGFWTAGSR